MLRLLGGWPLNAWPWFPSLLLVLTGVAAALLVSLHALLHKRDVGSAIGWIGLAWLSPIAGGMLYLIFGINRVRRRARRLRERHGSHEHTQAHSLAIHPDHSFAALARAAGRITGRAAESGNAVQVFCNGDAAYPAMLEAIAVADHSIALSSYILRDDAAGGPFIDALIAAHRRGLTVRVLIDGIGGGYFHSPAYSRLRRNGVPVARFLQALSPWRMPVLNLRTHRKILAVDGRRAFTGGMNIGAENVLAGQPPQPVRDTHFSFEGPVVAQLVAAFAEDWWFEMKQELTGDIWFPSLAPAGTAVARVITSGPDQDVEKIEFLILEAIACARRSVRFMTPYFLPDEREITALALAQLRGVDVDIILPVQSNHRLVDWATYAHIGPLLAEGCRIWRNPPPFDHSKIMVVDGEWCLIGSANWDIRSLRLNFELDVEIYDKNLGAQLENHMQNHHTQRLSTADLNARTLPHRLRDAAARLLMPYL
ncbi:MAG TPA: phospholipase D-like domain-containing protein [Acetobacteraceae bacterium]|nr:phospholipase D-like domain-containing protein [Acetobacteraceae bacterium]